MENEKSKMENGVDVSGVVVEMRDKQDSEPVKEKVKDTFSFLKINKGVADKIQSDADESKIAKLLNHLIFTMTPCKNRKLTEEEVQQINAGGAIVASIMVIMPNLPLNHPFIILGVRLISLYIKVQVICSTATEKVKDLRETMSDKLGGIKDFKTIEHK